MTLETKTIGIVLNGESRRVPEGLHIAGLLKFLEIDGQKVYGHMDYGKKDPSLGAGEEALAAVGAAIANAFYDATGVQLTEYPMTPKRVLAALKT